MRKIINECYKKSKHILSENKELLDLIANALLKYETITKEQIDYLVEHKHMPEEKQDEENQENTNGTGTKECGIGSITVYD
jgi:cell division protease FtsH